MKRAPLTLAAVSGVEDAEVAPDVPVRLRLEGNCVGSPLRRISRFSLSSLPTGTRSLSRLGDGEQHVLQFFFQLGPTRVVLLDAAGDFFKLLKTAETSCPAF